jgi:hypothetical protein
MYFNYSLGREKPKKIPLVTEVYFDLEDKKIFLIF